MEMEKGLVLFCSDYSKHLIQLALFAHSCKHLFLCFFYLTSTHIYTPMIEEQLGEIILLNDIWYADCISQGLNHQPYN